MNESASCVRANLGKKITALALSITGMFLATVCFFVVVCFVVMALISEGTAEGITTIVLAIVYGMLSGVPSIVALALSGSCRKVGDTTVLTRLSKIFGIIGLALTAGYMIMGLMPAFVVAM